MVGYGKIHHRGSTLPSMNVNPKHVGCREDKYFQSSCWLLNPASIEISLNSFLCSVHNILTDCWINR
ncbi:hypothetical protein MTR_3g114380 [Medicago truncatula]|uniref:Uncharacterized protein n=1 Tax=Medicago truncatula TaxID=3880 RepID=G7J5C6_MEDTR|nr:hypothetical protein MTR_3g114380 [Medicago truncatula]